jgi:ubiquinone/menaquinone biosynthesis C-methylase UbiE
MDEAMGRASFLNPSLVLQAAGVEPGMRVADLGAGSGFFTRAAARLVGDGGVVWAVDTQRDLVTRIKNFAIAEGLANVEILHGDVEVVGGTNLPDNSFDFVIVANLLFSIEHRGECIAEVRRILKKSGRALFIDWSDSFGGLGPHPDHVVTAPQGEKLLLSHAMTMVGKVRAGDYHWGLVVRKKSA